MVEGQAAGDGSVLPGYSEEQPLGSRWELLALLVELQTSTVYRVRHFGSTDFYWQPASIHRYRFATAAHLLDDYLSVRKHFLQSLLPDAGNVAAFDIEVLQVAERS